MKLVQNFLDRHLPQITLAQMVVHYVLFDTNAMKTIQVKSIDTSRVTRLGEFVHWVIVYFSKFLKITK
jgi:hypothetical protein